MVGQLLRNWQKITKGKAVIGKIDGIATQMLQCLALETFQQYYFQNG